MITGRTGAGFAAVDDKGKLVAYGWGIPPPHINTIPGAEAWTVSLVLRNTLSRKAIITDCLGNVRMYQRGRLIATDGKRPLARIWNSIFNAIDNCDDTNALKLHWMAAHRP